jgi:hypothetical protein
MFLQVKIPEYPKEEKRFAGNKKSYFLLQN